MSEEDDYIIFDGLHQSDEYVDMGCMCNDIPGVI